VPAMSISKGARQAIAVAAGVAVFIIGLVMIDSLRASFVSVAASDAAIPDSLLTYLACYAALAGWGAGCIVNYWLAL
jgi:hypothetical protein